MTQVSDNGKESKNKSLRCQCKNMGEMPFKLTLLRPGSPNLSYDIKKIEISGDKATVECIQRFGNKTFPRKFDLVSRLKNKLIKFYDDIN